jgi:UDP-N-acetylmuramate dehydrogenase
VTPTAVAEAAAMLTDRLGGRVRRDEPVASMTTYKVGGAASVFVEVASIGDLVAVAQAREATAVDVLVVGRGSNMLIADEGFAGVAVSIAGLADQIEIPPVVDRDDPSAYTVVAGGAVSLPVLARRTAAASLTGFEWAVGVPGSIGGAVRMNAGGHGSDMAACLIDVDVFDLESTRASLITLAAGELGLRFRASSLAPAHVVISARVGLSAGSRAESEAEIAEIVRWRREHQPGGQNCGSVFVNPVPGEVTAGELIDRLGLRGFRVGTASVSEKHANFVQADEGGRAADVRAVIEAVRARVRAETGYALRSEVRLVGFDDTDPLAFDDRLVAAPVDERP